MMFFSLGRRDVILFHSFNSGFYLALSLICLVLKYKPRFSSNIYIFCTFYFLHIYLYICHKLNNTYIIGPTNLISRSGKNGRFCVNRKAPCCSWLYLLVLENCQTHMELHGCRERTRYDSGHRSCRHAEILYIFIQFYYFF